jgi:ribonuclease R
LPSRQEIIAFIAASPGPVGKREIAKAFKIRPADRVALKGLLKDIERSGADAPDKSDFADAPNMSNFADAPDKSDFADAPDKSDFADATGRNPTGCAGFTDEIGAGAPPAIERRRGRRFAAAASLPEIAVVELFALDTEGEALCRLLGAEPATDNPRISFAGGRGAAELGVGERAVVRLRRQSDGSYAAALIRRLTDRGERVLGVFAAHQDGGGTVTPTDRRHKTTYRVRATEAMKAQDGELVLAVALPMPRLGLPHVQIVERLGRIDDPRSISLVAIHANGIPVEFSAEALAEAAAARPVALGTRTDLRGIPLITIDGADARDFDDAVWAEPDGEGWHVLVAIADVSWYVRPGSALDRAAEERGNSVYFPDRVVPMLPEALSNELCSLKPGVERACLAIHLRLDADGEITRHETVRGLMRSAARLTYEEVQAAMDGPPGALRDTILAPLYGAYRALDRARRARGTLELDLPERRVVLGADGTVARIETRQRLDSHRLIEEFMIAANVAAAETLERVKRPCMYRVHDAPDPAKLANLQDFLEGLGIPGLKLTKGQVVRPQHFGAILAAAAERPESPLISELVLRAQAQAVYAPENLGHFGLALRRYAHFTSPIRRYADLLVHRALVSGLNFGEGGLGPVDPDSFAELGAHISRTERRAALAERNAVDRYTTAFMAAHVGAVFSGRINGVTRFGLFVTLDDTGADGLVPISTLPADYYHHDAEGHALIGERSRRVFTLGDRVGVRLAEADPVGGGLLFQLIEGGGEAVRSRTGAFIRRAAPRRQGRR